MITKEILKLLEHVYAAGYQAAQYDCRGVVYFSYDYLDSWRAYIKEESQLTVSTDVTDFRHENDSKSDVGD